MKADEAIKLILAMDDGEWLSAFDEVGLYHYSDTLSNILSDRPQPEWRILDLKDYMISCLAERDNREIDTDDNMLLCLKQRD